MDSDEETLLLTLLLSRKLAKRKKKCRRRLWEDPIWSFRLLESDYYVLYCERIKNNNKHFYDYLRMPRRTFNELLQVIQNDIKFQDTHLRISVSPEERLVITLR
jgi:hypothetical protein